MKYKLDGLKFHVECPVCHEMHNLTLVLCSKGNDHKIKCHACNNEKKLVSYVLGQDD